MDGCAVACAGYVLGPSTVLKGHRCLSMAFQPWALCLLLEGGLEGATKQPVLSSVSPASWAHLELLPWL